LRIDPVPVPTGDRPRPVRPPARAGGRPGGCRIRHAVGTLRSSCDSAHRLSSVGAGDEPVPESSVFSLLRWWDPVTAGRWWMPPMDPVRRRHRI